MTPFSDKDPFRKDKYFVAMAITSSARSFGSLLWQLRQVYGVWDRGIADRGSWDRGSWIAV